jgi:hypothetical protein
MWNRFHNGFFSLLDFNLEDFAVVRMYSRQPAFAVVAGSGWGTVRWPMQGAAAQIDARPSISYTSTSPLRSCLPDSEQANEDWSLNLPEFLPQNTFP